MQQELIPTVTENDLSLSNVLILGRLGRGSTSHVFRTQSTKTKKLYAMKVIDKKSSSYSYRVFQKQLQIHTKLRHRHVVRLVKHLQDYDNQYVITEYCGGGEMTKLIMEDISEEKIAFIVYQIVIGLQYLHEKEGISHCDLKLSNILIENFTIKICDFGYSHHIQFQESIEAGNGGDLYGTLFYMAPQILKHKKRVYFQEGDVWALGICILTLLSKMQPYQGNSYYEIKKQIINGDHVNIDNCSTQLKQLLKGLLQLNPKQRLTIKEILDHDFFKKYQTKKNYEMLFQSKYNSQNDDITKLKAKFDLNTKKNGIIKGSKMQVSEKLTSESESSDREGQCCLSDKDRKRSEENIEQTQKKNEKAKIWSFKRKAYDQDRQKNDNTLDKKGIKIASLTSQYDNNETVRKQLQNNDKKERLNDIQTIKKDLSDFKTPKQKETIQKYASIQKMTEKTIQNDMRRLQKIECKLISPFSEFYYETKNNGYIKILENGDLQIMVKKTIFHIFQNGTVLRFKDKDYAFEDIKDKNKFKQVYQLYEYAYDVIQIFKYKKFSKYILREFNQMNNSIAISKDRKHFYAQLYIKSKGQSFIFTHKKGNSLIKIISKTKEEIYIDINTMIMEGDERILKNYKKNELEEELREAVCFFLQQEKYLLE